MRYALLTIGLIALAAMAASGADTKRNSAPAGQNSIVITFRDGHQQSFSLSEIDHIEFRTPTAVSSPLAAPGRNHFVGKWEVGDGAGSTFYITLDADGTARKSLGATHGTWELVDGEARISWDDGWHDAIRKIGSKHEKFAYRPGTTFSDKADNVTNARNTRPQPI